MGEGYTLRYGLTYVDFATQTRIIKDSGHWYHKFMQGGEHLASGDQVDIMRRQDKEITASA